MSYKGLPMLLHLTILVRRGTHPIAFAESLYSHLQDDPQLHQIVSPTVLMPTSSSQTSASINGQHFFPPGNGEVRRPQERHSSAVNAPTPQSRQSFPPLPGFAPPVSATHILINSFADFSLSGLPTFSRTNLQCMELLLARRRHLRTSQKILCLVLHLLPLLKLFKVMTSLFPVCI